jgi:serine/threonine protein phosphatase PrpC/cell division protein FtsL
VENKFQLAVITHQGMVRANNEDAYAVTADLASNDWHSTVHTSNSATRDAFELNAILDGGVLLAVADGMGGANAGEVAAKIAIETICDTLAKPANKEHLSRAPRAALFEILLEANRRIISYSREHPASRGMGTTCVIAYINPDGCHIAWVGDSRAYLFNNEDGLLQLSKDHSLVQELVDNHQLTQEEAFYHPDSNIITQSLGDPDRIPDPGYIQTNLKKGDEIILCSDGLNSMIYDENLEQIIKGAGTIQADALAALLVDSANEAGGNDNITIAVFQLTEGLIAESNRVNQVEETSNAAWSPSAAPNLEYESPAKPSLGSYLTRFKNLRKILLLILMSVAAIFSIFVFVRQKQRDQQKAIEEKNRQMELETARIDSLYRDSMSRYNQLMPQDSANINVNDTLRPETNTIDSNPDAQTAPVPPTEKKK